MATQTFWSLVKHDMKFHKSRKTSLSKPWIISYWAVAVIAVLVATTYASLHAHLDLTHIWYFTFGLPFMVFGMSAGLTGREWKNGTVGWWLSLPISRTQLVFSKFVAAIIRTGILCVVVYCAATLLMLYSMMIEGSIVSQSAGASLLGGLKWFALVLCAAPFAGAFGVLFAVLGESRARPAIPIIWIAFGGMWWLLFSSNSVFPHTHSTAPVGTVTLCCLIAVGLILAYLMIRLAAYLLDRQMTL